MAVRRVTKAVVDRLPISSVVWDADVRGFGVRRQQRDASYVLKVRVGTRQRIHSISLAPLFDWSSHYSVIRFFQGLLARLS
jgi:hypothetical protein